MFIVLVNHDDRWWQFDEPVHSYDKALQLVMTTSLPWVITIVVNRDRGVSL